MLVLIDSVNFVVLWYYKYLRCWPWDCLKMFARYWLVTGRVLKLERSLPFNGFVIESFLSACLFLYTAYCWLLMLSRLFWFCFACLGVTHIFVGILLFLVVIRHLLDLNFHSLLFLSICIVFQLLSIVIMVKCTCLNFPFCFLVFYGRKSLICGGQKLFMLIYVWPWEPGPYGWSLAFQLLNLISNIHSKERGDGQWI